MVVAPLTTGDAGNIVALLVALQVRFPDRSVNRASSRELRSAPRVRPEARWQGVRPFAA